MSMKEGTFVNLVMGRWSYCLLAAVFHTKFFKFYGRHYLKMQGAKEGSEVTKEVVIHEFIVVPILLLYD